MDFVRSARNDAWIQGPHSEMFSGAGSRCDARRNCRTGVQQKDLGPMIIPFERIDSIQFGEGRRIFEKTKK